MTFDAQFDNHPAAKIILSVNRSAYQKANGAISFDYNGYTIKVNADIDGDNADASIVVTNKTNGAYLTIFPDTQSDTGRGSLVVNNNIVGSVRADDNFDNTLIIEYQDGSFESVAF